MVPADMVVATSCRLSIVTMYPSAAVWPQFFNAMFKAIYFIFYFNM